MHVCGMGYAVVYGRGLRWSEEQPKPTSKYKQRTFISVLNMQEHILKRQCLNRPGTIGIGGHVHTKKWRTYNIRVLDTRGLAKWSLRHS